MVLVVGGGPSGLGGGALLMSAVNLECRAVPLQDLSCKRKVDVT